MLKRVVGSKIIRLYDENGQFIKEIAVIDFEPLFDWILFLAILLPGIIILSHRL